MASRRTYIKYDIYQNIYIRERTRRCCLETVLVLMDFAFFHCIPLALSHWVLVRLRNISKGCAYRYPDGPAISYCYAGGSRTAGKLPL